jgi:hypothetical protein
LEDETIGLGNMINKNQGVKEVANLNNIQSRIGAWPFRLLEHQQGLIKTVDP